MESTSNFENDYQGFEKVSESILSRASQRPMLQVNDQPSGGRSHLCNADRHAKYKKATCKKLQLKKQNTKKQNTKNLKINIYKTTKYKNCQTNENLI